MASEEQVAAGAAILAASPMIDKPKLPAECWHGLARAVIDAAEQAKDAERRKNCKHVNKRSYGTVNSDGSSRFDWYCRECWASGSTETPPNNQAISPYFTFGHY